MARNITSNSNIAAQAEVARPVFFVKLEYDSGTSCIHSGVGDLVFDGSTYTGIGNLGTISAIEENSELSANGVTLTLSGISTAHISTALGDSYHGRPATIYLGFLDTSHQLIADPVMVFSGKMDTQSIDLGENASITITVENRLVDWDRPRVLRYNNETQQNRFAGDKGFEFVEQAAEKRIVWGQKDRT